MTAPLVAGNRVRLLQSGAEFFPALLNALDSARDEILLETYIFADDEVGRQVAAALARAARRGVRVHLMVDGFGSQAFARGLGQDLLAQGVQLLVYRPELGGWLSRLRFRRSRLRRLHRKLAVVDGGLAYVGGINIVDDWDNLHSKAQVPPRFDYAIEVVGPLVTDIHRNMGRLWALVRWSRLGRRPPERAGGVVGMPLPAIAGQSPARFLIRDNLRHRRDIEEAYLAAIAGARQDILLANAYFLPGRRFLRALCDASRRGVRVTLLLQGRVEYWLQHQATQSLYERLLAAGIQVFEYHQSFLHAKVGVVDGAWATVGSSNIDPFSLLLAREANVVVEDTAFADGLTTSLTRALTNGARRVDGQARQHRSGWARASGRIAYLLLRLATALSHPRAKGEYY